MMADEREPEQATNERTPIGQRLRAARENVGISEGQVATALNLDRAIVTALEGGDFDSLGAPIFVKGHLRNYARLVKIDPDEVIADFEELERYSVPDLPTRTGRGVKMDERGGWGSKLAWIILALIVIGIAYWVYQNGELAGLVKQSAAGAQSDVAASTAPTVKPSITPAESGSASGAQPAFKAGGVPQVATLPQSRTVADATVAPAASADTALPTVGSMVNNGTPVPAQAADTRPDIGQRAGADESSLTSMATNATAMFGDTASRTPSAGDAPAAAQVAIAAEEDGVANRETTPQAQTNEGLRAAEAQGGLPVALRLTGASWIEVNDAAGNRLYYGLAEQGETLYLTGPAPLSVFLGNAHHVRVLTAGNVIETGDFTRPDNSARFVIHQNGDNPAYATDPVPSL